MTDFAILTLDPAGRITSWNPGAGNVFGYAAGGGDRPALLELLFTEADRAAGIPEEELQTAPRARPGARRALDAAQGRHRPSSPAA